MKSSVTVKVLCMYVLPERALDLTIIDDSSCTCTRVGCSSDRTWRWLKIACRKITKIHTKWVNKDVVPGQVVSEMCTCRVGARVQARPVIGR